MTCPACLNDNEPSARYCRECGRSLDGQALEDHGSLMGVWSDRPRPCANCGRMIAARSRFCTNCGMSATDERSPSSGWVIGVAISLAIAATSFTAIVVRLYGK
jgi:uncharacterized OB-fold protein